MIRMGTVFTLIFQHLNSLPYFSKIWTNTIYYPVLCLKIARWVANSVDPDITGNHLTIVWPQTMVYWFEVFPKGQQNPETSTLVLSALVGCLFYKEVRSNKIDSSYSQTIVRSNKAIRSFLLLYNYSSVGLLFWKMTFWNIFFTTELDISCILTSWGTIYMKCPTFFYWKKWKYHQFVICWKYFHEADNSMPFFKVNKG